MVWRAGIHYAGGPVTLHFSRTLQYQFILASATLVLKAAQFRKAVVGLQVQTSVDEARVCHVQRCNSRDIGARLSRRMQVDLLTVACSCLVCAIEFFAGPNNPKRVHWCQRNHAICSRS